MLGSIFATCWVRPMFLLENILRGRCHRLRSSGIFCERKRACDARALHKWGSCFPKGEAELLFCSLEENMLLSQTAAGNRYVTMYVKQASHTTFVVCAFRATRTSWVIMWLGYCLCGKTISVKDGWKNGTKPAKGVRSRYGCLWSVPFLWKTGNCFTQQTTEKYFKKWLTTRQRGMLRLVTSIGKLEGIFALNSLGYGKALDKTKRKQYHKNYFSLAIVA